MYRILIVEDDHSLSNGVCLALNGGDTQTAQRFDLLSARELLRCESFDLVLLDVNLPDGSGLELLRELKMTGGTAVILLTANDTELDVVTGLGHGADDYITKPFSLAILRARVNTQLRRSRCTSAPAVLGSYVFDFEQMNYFHNGAPVELSKTEQKLLRLLVEHKGNTLTRETLLARVWGDGMEFVDENTLSVAIKRLRDKLDAAERIKTVYGVGYVWAVGK